MDAIAAHGLSAYPAEGCGLVTEDGSGRQQAHPCTNIQDRLHDRDPAAHPRTSREAYRMDDLEVHRALAEAERAGRRLAAIYHTHVDCDAYFSQEDRQAAVFMDEPVFPRTAYLVISVTAAGLGPVRAFQWDAAARTFVEAALTIEADAGPV